MMLHESLSILTLIFIYPHPQLPTHPTQMHVKNKLVDCFSVAGSPTVLKTLTALTPGSTVLKTSGGMTTILSAGNLVKKIQSVQPKGIF